MDATISCKCGNTGGWEDFAAGQGKWSCPKCGDAWGTRMVDVETVLPVMNRRKDLSGLTNHRVADCVEMADCPICGDAYEVWKRNATSVYPRKTCGKNQCQREATTRGRKARMREEVTSPARGRIMAAAERETRWMADARMCPVV